MPSAIYRARPKSALMLYGSPIHPTLAACGGELPPSGLSIEAMHYLARVDRGTTTRPARLSSGRASVSPSCTRK